MALPKELGPVIQQILSPSPEDAEELLEEIGLGGIPSSEQVHQKIEAKLLSPPDTLPDHWLSTYQMYGSFPSGLMEFIIFGTDTGNLSLTYPRCSRSNPHHHPRV